MLKAHDKVELRHTKDSWQGTIVPVETAPGPDLVRVRWVYKGQEDDCFMSWEYEDLLIKAT